jgi:hypothetical protein
MIQIEYIYPLDFEDVLQFIPMLTIDNDVKTDGKILHLEITKSKPTKPLHLFIDLKTKEYCFNYKKQKDTDLLYEIGDIVISKLHRFKLNRYDVYFEGLIGYIKGNITADETIEKRKK